MLKRDIKIVTDTGMLSHYIKDVHWESGGIRIMQADPVYSLNISQSRHQVSQAALFIQIQPVVGRILSNQQQFLGTSCSLDFCFPYQLLYGFGNVVAPHQRNGAERTGTVAAF